jgi:riboflavin biosynthesis pyrimidine reductase
MTSSELILANYVAERKAPPHRPWISSVMISSIDSAIDVNGTSGPLGNETDRKLLTFMRQQHSGVLVGASTAQNEAYRPSRIEHLEIFVASNSASLDWETPLWHDERTTLITTRNAPPVPDSVRVIRSGIDSVDVHDAMHQLRERGIERLSCEGGPRLNQALIAADLFDEISLTLSPFAVLGTIFRPASTQPFEPRRFRLAANESDGDWVFLRYLRDPETHG